MNKSQKLNLFVGLGCKPMRDVVLHINENKSYVGESTHSLDRRTKTSKFAYVEAIPERLTQIEISTNLLNLFNDYGEIETVKDIVSVKP